MVSDFSDKSILIVGLGLMGGSIAKALQDKDHGPIWAIDIDVDVLTKATNDGLIDKGFTDAKDIVADADFIIVCLYPQQAVAFINDNMQMFKQGVVITDICGVKKPIIDGVVHNLRKDIDFVPAHPMAGSERKGYACSYAELFEGCHYIMTPIDSNTDEAIALVEYFAMKLGAHNIVKIDPSKHDEYIAYTSQIPHALAIAYMHSSNERDVTPYAGGSFRDVSRVALINEVMWTELFNQNKKELVSELKELQKQLGIITDLVEQHDSKKLREYMKKGAQIKENYDATTDG
ncbi:MAG: prephenate dehydrogenase [Clostridiales bacterium]|nr:prephenate dehydrogenase [Clostridiales bacterium]